MQLSLTSTEYLRAHQRRRRSLLAMIFFTVFGVAIFGTSQANASCGDYLLLRGEVGRSSSSDMTENQQTHRNSHRTPCHGPHCQQGPSQFPPAIPAVSIELQDRWVWLSTIAKPVLDQTSSLAQISEPITLPMFAFRLDRPPKV